MIGNLTRNPELRATQSGVSVCTFGLAVNRRRKVEGQPEVDFFNITVWRQLGELCHKYLVKGRKCCIVGEVQPRTYEALDGTKRTVVDIIADDVEFLSSAESKPQVGVTDAMAAVRQAGFTQVDEDELPF